jgi:rubrerythrin
MKKSTPDQKHVEELLYQALQTEQGGIKIYENAVQCAVNPDLKKEWTEYLKQTRHHEKVLLGVFKSLGLDPSKQTPGRKVVGHIGDSLVAAKLVAGECVTLAETKDHMNWELIGHVAKHSSGDQAKVLKAAFDEVEEDEDHHLYHTTGWTRELWIQALGFPAVLPPPEEVKDVETAIGASRAEQSRDKMAKAPKKNAKKEN